ncbi:ABC transporter permease [Microbacterium sp. 179-I 3D2 NHS]|uniref:ABC transporter permease n=1 Tax=Microbacterium sp. 179-I 3D2 NHS TaxID=3235178 RepID=UPI0039A05A85
MNPTSTEASTEASTADVGTTAPPEESRRARAILNEIIGGNVTISVLAVVLALAAGGILIAVTDPAVQQASTYFFGRPGDVIGAAWAAVAGAYTALFQGAVFQPAAGDFTLQIRPLTETLAFATPLIVAGLGVGLAFRVGLFNIGGRGQMLIAAACAGWVAVTVDLPPAVHLPLAMIVGVAGGALWGALAGVLKARTGAHEVIVTIMLNYVAFYLVSYLLRTPVLQAPGSNNPKSAPLAESATLPLLFGPGYSVTMGFPIVIVVTVLVWWLMSRSSLGYQFRAVGLNPNAARFAGIDVKNMYVWAMLISGALVGLAGVLQVLGPARAGFTSGVDAGIGFDAITVALLGRSRPVGVFVAGILFGAFKAGGFTMQAAQGIPIDIVLVVQSLIVLFIAAPPLVRAVFRLPRPDQLHARRHARITTRKAASA